MLRRCLERGAVSPEPAAAGLGAFSLYSGAGGRERFAQQSGRPVCIFMDNREMFVCCIYM